MPTLPCRRDKPGATLDTLNPPARLAGNFFAPHAPLEINPKGDALSRRKAVTMLSHVPLAATMAAIAVFLPSFQHFRHDKFLIAPAEPLRESRFAAAIALVSKLPSIGSIGSLIKERCTAQDAMPWRPAQASRFWFAGNLYLIIPR